MARSLHMAARTVLVLCSLGLGSCNLGDERDDDAVVRIGYSLQPDSLDPAMAYTVEGYSVLWSVHTAPLTYRHAEGLPGTELVPGLAEAMPNLSRDARTYRFRFRPGLRYSDGSPLRASDFEHSIKRVLFLASPGAKFFVGITGAERYLKLNQSDADIPGIEADDRARRVTIRLDEPDGTFLNVLASPFAAPVPARTPFERLTTKPPPGIGPFRIARSEPNRRISLTRNERLPRLPHVPRAGLPRLEIEIMPSARRQAYEIARNRLDFMLDPLPAELVREMKHDYPERYEEHVSNSTYYFWLNSSIEPFDNHELRRAVHLAIDKEGVARLYGGLLQPTCNFLPPRMPGYRALDPCPFGDPGERSDIKRARAIVEREGAHGARISVWSHTLDPTDAVAAAFADRLEQIGLRPRLETVAPAVYYQTIGSSRTPRLHAGVANWFQDFPHPASFMAAVRGDLIAESGNYNFSHTDIPALTRRIKTLQGRPELEPTLEEWAAIDRAVVEDAGIIPYGHLRYTTFASERMDLAECPPFHSVLIADFARLCTK